jgi:hypothetical protein
LGTHVSWEGMISKVLLWLLLGGVINRGGTLRPKWVYFLHAPRVWATLLAGFKLSSDMQRFQGS